MGVAYPGCAHKEFIDGESEIYGFVIRDTYRVIFLMEEYGDVMFPLSRYSFLVVVL